MFTPSRLKALVRQLIRQTHGQDLIEYAVLIALIAAVVIVTAGGIGLKVPGLYEPTVAALPGDPGESSGPGRGGNPGTGNPGNDKPVGNGGGGPGGSGGNPGRGGGN